MKNTIKYSLSMRANPMNAEEEKKAYASMQLTGTLNLEDLAAHIHDHNTVFSKGVILGVLVDMTHCVREALIEGNAVSLGELGTFRPTISSIGAESKTDAETGEEITAMEAFTESNISQYNINFEKGPGLIIRMDELDFEYTTTRAAQAAAKRAQKKGETSADWSEDDDGNNGGNVNP